MRDNHGERIIARDLVDWIRAHFADDDELLIMVGEGDGAPAAIMAWNGETNAPSERALDVPVFTRMPAFFERDDAPSVHHVLTPNEIVFTRLGRHAERTARAFPGLSGDIPATPDAVEAHPWNEIPG
jgi:hypothetical protein